jgi:hypothetical protein
VPKPAREATYLLAPSVFYRLVLRHLDASQGGGPAISARTCPLSTRRHGQRAVPACGRSEAQQEHEEDTRGAAPFVTFCHSTSTAYGMDRRRRDANARAEGTCGAQPLQPLVMGELAILWPTQASEISSKRVERGA